MAEYDQESQSGPLLKGLGKDEAETPWTLDLSDKHHKYGGRAYREGVNAFQKFLIFVFICQPAQEITL
jgi:hypothetical protein